jgi:UDP-glucuronate decarboxylase
MKVLVVGGSGFIGNEICRKLNFEGFEVVNMSRNPGLVETVPHIFGDLRFPDSYEKWVTKFRPEVIIQTAWITDYLTHRQSAENLEYTSKTIRLAQFAENISVKHFIALGSSVEYGYQEFSCNAQNTKPQPFDLYGQEKFRVSRALKEIAINSHTRFTWARVFQAYGPGQEEHRFIPSAIKSLKAKNLIDCINPDLTLDWISSRDIASALLWTLFNDLPGEIDLGTSIGITVENTAKQIAKLLGASETLVTRSKSLSTQKISKLVADPEISLLASGWSPQDTLETGLSWSYNL